MTEEEKKASAAPYVVAGLSFIPGIGILIGLGVCIWGLTSRRQDRKKVAGIAAGGLAFNIAAYSALFYFGFAQRGGVYDGLRAKMAASNLTTVVQAIEFYKVQNGHYPDTLDTLRNSLPKGSFVFVFDPTDVKLGGQPRSFYYQLIDERHYYLRGVGPDGVPFTPDDIVPTVSATPGGNVGLVIEKQEK